jgi:hypothetical protein
MLNDAAGGHKWEAALGGLQHEYRLDKQAA